MRRFVRECVNTLDNWKLFQYNSIRLIVVTDAIGGTEYYQSLYLVGAGLSPRLAGYFY